MSARIEARARRSLFRGAWEGGEGGQATPSKECTLIFRVRINVFSFPGARCMITLGSVCWLPFT